MRPPAASLSSSSVKNVAGSLRSGILKKILPNYGRDTVIPVDGPKALSLVSRPYG